MSRRWFAWVSVVLFGGMFVTFVGAATPEMIVHEWGTFTSLQDESGRAIGGINADDEPVPGFVHEVGGRHIIDGSPDVNRLALALSKSIPASHPDVTMRLETPVIYFHLPKDAKPTPVDVSVTFRGGWLTEFYPYAAADVDGVRFNPSSKAQFKFARMTDATTGGLGWSKLMVGTDGVGPKTDARVWLAPRAVPAAANVTTTVPPPGKDRPNESEKYVFYRGIGRVDSPMRVTRDGETLRLSAASIAGPVWLVDIRDNGQCAFRAVDLADGAGATSAAFGHKDYKPNTDELRKVMRAALVADGLFEDEADAMLNTWEVSYFKSAGTRVFFMVPRAWTDAVLPLTIASEGKPIPAERMVRTMVGRVELVTPTHRELMKVVANPPTKNVQLAAYKELGRFRDALVIEEHTSRPTQALTELRSDQFIGQYKFSQDEPADVLSGG